MSKRKAKEVIVKSEDDDDEEMTISTTSKPRVAADDDQSEEELDTNQPETDDDQPSSPPTSDSDNDRDHKRKKKRNLSKLKQFKPKTKTLDFNVFLSRIKSLPIDCTCLNYMRDEDQLVNPSPKYMLNSTKLKNHQWEAVSWLKSLLLDNNTSGILGDDMGLGKTLEVISFFCYWMELIDKDETETRKPFLIVSPLSLIENWCLEFNKFCGNSIRVLRYHGSQQERAELQDTLNEEFAECGEFPYDVIVTSYETVTNDESFLSSFEYKCLCVDEAHRLKNPNSVLYKALQQIYKYERVILMSGTPLMNNTKELWALLYFCAPNYFDHLFETFDGWFPQQCFLSKANLKKSISESVEVEDYDESVEDVDADNVRTNFQAVLKPFLLRRTKNQVLKNDLPPKEEHIIYTRLTTLQKKFYKGFLTADRNAIGKKNSRGLSNVLISLRKCCDHPYMFDGAEPEPFSEGEHIVNNSGKMIILDKLLKKLKQEGHKVLLFSQMTQMLDILQDYMHFRKWNYERLDGSVRGEERFEAIKSFTDKDVFVFLLSTRAGGVGLNLISADTVIFMDMDMNPQMDLQAQARCHRIGQDKPVTVYRLVTESSVEEVILKRSMKKIALSINTIDTSSAVSNAFDSASDDKLSSDTIMEMISFGLHKIMDSTTDSTDDSDEKLLEITIDELLAKKGPKRLSLSLESAAESLQDVESGSIYMYDGVDYRQKASSSSKDVEALQNILGDVDICSQKTEHHTKKTKKKAPPKKSKKTAKKDESLILSSEEDLVSADEIDDGYISPISTRTRASKRVATTKRRKVQSSDDEESEYDEYDPHLIEIPDDWELEVYLMEKEFNREEDDDPLSPITTESNTIHYVKGDVTQPEKYEHSGTRFIVNVISDFGTFPTAGISKHITSKYGKKIKTIYENACEQEQIAVGEAQLIPVKSKKGNTYIVNVIAQHYEKSKGHGPIINTALEIALDKVCYAAVTNDATIHMPRIGFGIQGFDWYSTERIIKKCLLKAKVKTFVYYFDRTGSYSNWSKQQQTQRSTPTKPVTPKVNNSTPKRTNTPKAHTTPTKTTPVSTASPVQQTEDFAKDDPLEGMKIYLFGAENKNNKKLKGSITLNGGVICAELKSLDMIVVNIEKQFEEVDLDEIEDQETILARRYVKENPQCTVVTASSILEMIGN